MGRQTSQQASLFLCLLVAGMLSQNLLNPVMSQSFEDQKNYYSPDPHAGTPPTGHHGTPPSHEGGYTPTPSHGGGYTPTPSHGGGYTPTPSHGGGYTPTPSHGGGYTPTPSHGGGYTPTPSHGGGYTPSPSTPSGGNCGAPPHEPSTPSTPSYTPSPPHDGGGYYNSPPPSGGSSPPTPVYVSPPTTPYIDPGTPVTPTPPFFPAPSGPFGGTCDFWRNHPGLIWGVLGWWGTVGSSFGVTSIPGFGANTSLQQALSNTRHDGIGALYREGTASLLNSMVNNRFPYTTKQVRENFVAALGSNRAASSQAQIFKLANEGRLKPRA
ncbi:hypothetical protein SLA2020_050150 [Shorea laevis]